MPAVNPSPLIPLRRHLNDTEAQPRLDVRVRWSALELDAALSRGSDPASGEELALRAAQLADPAQRERLARSINDLVLLAEGRFGAQLPTTRAPITADRVRTSRARLLELRERLLGEGPHSPRGLALVNLLLEDPTGPLYSHELSGDQLQPTLEEALAAL
jgi:hypothetical protein